MRARKSFSKELQAELLQELIIVEHAIACHGDYNPLSPIVLSTMSDEQAFEAWRNS